MTSSEYERKFQRFFMNKSQQSIKKFHQFLGLTFATHLLWFHLIMDRVQCERCCQIAAIYFTWHCLIKSTHSQTIATETMKNSANIFSLFLCLLCFSNQLLYCKRCWIKMLPYAIFFFCAAYIVVMPIYDFNQLARSHSDYLINHMIIHIFYAFFSLLNFLFCSLLHTNSFFGWCICRHAKSIWFLHRAKVRMGARICISPTNHEIQQPTRIFTFWFQPKIANDF